MAIDDQDIIPVSFGDEGTEFIYSQLRFAIRGFDGELGKRLIELDLTSAVGFVRVKAIEANKHRKKDGTIDFEAIRVAGGGDSHLAVAVARWLKTPDRECFHYLMLEELLARYSDPSVDPATIHYGARIFEFADSKADHEGVMDTFSLQSPYPGVGILTSPPLGFSLKQELTDEMLNTFVGATCAVLIRAWDDEGYLIAPVGSKISIESFVGSSVKVA
jgi:hypothetical protein